MTRRRLIAAAAPAWLVSQTAAAQTSAMRNMGIAPTATALRARFARETNQPFDLVDHCHKFGPGAVQTRLPATDAESVKKFRQKLDTYNMRAVLSAPLPREEKDVPVFDAAVKANKEAGAVALHAAMTQRRYEQFTSADAFRKNFEQCRKSIALAEPVLRKYRIPLAIENHKGWRSAEQAEWMRRVSSEYVGVCFDFGNNLALCEDPVDTLRMLAPYTVFCHLKEMAVEPYEGGFLLSEVNFGDGFMDIGKMVETLQKKDPHMIFALEMITRDPLKVPVFTEGYWATFTDTSPLPGRDLAHVLDLVRKNRPKKPLPKISGMSPEAQVKFEDENNLQCINYARQHFNL